MTGARWLAVFSLALVAGMALLIALSWPGDDKPTPRPPPPRTRTDPPPKKKRDAGMKPPPVGAQDQAFNPGWVGAPCKSDADCPYENGLCLTEKLGFRGGYCSLRCDRLCPDHRGDLHSPTFCVTHPMGEGAVCVAQCNLHVSESGCRPGYVCSSTHRNGEDAVRLVCLPDHGTPPPPTECTEKLASLGIDHARPDLSDLPPKPARAGDPEPMADVCRPDTPILLGTPLRTVDFREKTEKHPAHLLVACELAVALDGFTELLAELDVVEVEHVGTYNCRGIAGSRSLSGHGRGLAIDVTGFERTTGTPISVQRDWDGPDKEKRRFLRSMVRELRERKVFDVVLTPQSDEAHADHLHLELREPTARDREEPAATDDAATVTDDAATVTDDAGE